LLRRLRNMSSETYHPGMQTDILDPLEVSAVADIPLLRE
jgi:hypothetical protein